MKRIFGLLSSFLPSAALISNIIEIARAVFNCIFVFGVTLRTLMQLDCLSVQLVICAAHTNVFEELAL